MAAARPDDDLVGTDSVVGAMAIVTSPERITSSQVIDASARRTAQIATQISVICVVFVAAVGTWWATSDPAPALLPNQPRSASDVDPIARAVQDALASPSASAKTDQPLVAALQIELARRAQAPESAQAMLDRLTPEGREAHNRDVLNRVVVPDRGVPGELRANLQGVVDAAQKATTPDARDKALVTALRPEVATRENETRTVVVQAGDTLSAISMRAYGDPNKYMRIFDANPRVLTSPHQLFIGMVLRVPS